MPRKFPKQKIIDNLNLFNSIARAESKPMIRNLINIYSSQTMNHKTPLNIIYDLSSRDKRTIDKGRRRYEAFMNKYNSNNYYAKITLYTDPSGRRGDTEEVEMIRARRRKLKYFKKLRQALAGDITIIESKIESNTYDTILRTYRTIKDFLSQNMHKLLTISALSLERQPTPEEIQLFKQMLAVIITDSHVKTLIESWGEDYITGIYIQHFRILNLDEIPKFQPLKVLNREIKISTRFRHISTSLDLCKQTLASAIMNKTYIENECFINAIYETYKDSLLKKKNERYMLRRDDILTIINKTEDNVKKGISINDIIPFFEKFRLQLRVYDQYCNLIFKYDPETISHNNKVMFCMMHDQHIYTLNHDIPSLQHLPGSKRYLPRASSNYNTHEDDERKIQYKMISSIDDILKIAKQQPKLTNERTTIYLIHEFDQLEDILYSLKNIGYTPNIRHDACRITHIFLEFNKITYIIRTQQLSTTTIERPIEVNSEIVYNKLNERMIWFRKCLIKNSYKSHYNLEDIDILDEYRTVANCGILKSTNSELAELDISKAYSAALSKITEIPIFNEFDVFIPYQNQAIKPLNLYIVKANNYNTFLNKTYNICYGKYIHEFIKDIHIIAFKTPSSIKITPFKRYIDELYSEDYKISDDPDEDMYLKKMIANVNIGMLEKSIDKKVKSNIFEDIQELKEYQRIYSGSITVISKYHCTDIADDDPSPDPQHPNHSPPIYRVSSKVKNTNKELYVLNITDTAVLKNGFRYIKELLVQIHNFHMYESINKLKNMILMYIV